MEPKGRANARQMTAPRQPSFFLTPPDGLLRFARNDGLYCNGFSILLSLNLRFSRCSDPAAAVRSTTHCLSLATRRPFDLAGDVDHVA